MPPIPAMRQPLFLLILLLLVGRPMARAQAATEDVLYLRNGSVLHGQRLPLRADAPGTVRLLLPTRDVLAFALTEIDSVKQQLIPVLAAAAERRRGFGHYTELGALAARNTNSSVNTSAFSSSLPTA